MKLFTILPKRTVIITESQYKSLFEDSYQDFQNDQSFRYQVIGKLSDMGYLFHGTDTQWDEFHSDKIKGGVRSNYGYGAYFTNAAYKCEEYGNEFVILDARTFNILDLMDVVDVSVFNNNSNQKEELLQQLYRIQDEKEYVRNIRDYDILTQEEDKIKEKLSTFLQNSNTEFINDLINAVISSNSDITYKDLNSIIRNKYNQDKLLSEYYLDLGYDGFKCGSEYVIFNFDKLNQNIVKDKNALIRDIMNITESRNLFEDMNIKIKPTSEWMQKWYAIMNERLFNGELGDCELRPFTTGKGSNGRTLGWFKITGNNIRVKRDNRRIFQKGYYGDETYVTRENFVSICRPLIELNANYSAPEESWLNTLVHEMCHYYTYMNGYAPKQGHGPEFRSIGYAVSSKSDGLITIQRLASAEEMKSFDLDDEIKSKNQAREDRKRTNTMAILIVMNNGEIRLITTTSLDLFRKVYMMHDQKGDAKYLGLSRDVNVINILWKNGYKNTMRTYRYWDITNESFISELIDGEWEDYIGGPLEYVLGIEKPEKEVLMVANDVTDEYKLGYKIVKDKNKYNMMDETNRKTFGTPVDKIWFNDDEQIYYFQNGRFTYKGMPGKWTKINVNESKMNEEMELEIISDFNDNDDISITSDMNLGIMSPFEINAL